MKRITLSLLLLISIVSSFGQVDTTKFQKYTYTGYTYKSIKVDSSLFAPRDTSKGGNIAVVGGVLYSRTLSGRWIASGASSYTFSYGLATVGSIVKADTLSLVSWSRLNKKSDSILAYVNASLAAKANTSSVPTQLSQLAGDVTHRVVTDAQISTWNSGTGGSGGGIPDIYIDTSFIKPDIYDSTKGLALDTAKVHQWVNTLGLGGSGSGTIDATPTTGSSNAVSSGGVYTALASKANSSSVPAQFNPIAGSNISLSGTYPNITINSSGGGGGGTTTNIVFYTPEAYITGDTSTDWGATFNAMMAAMPAWGGKIVLQNHKYKFNTTWVINKPCTIEGAGMGNNLEINTNAPTSIITTNPTLNVIEFATGMISIRDLAIEYKGSSTPTAGAGIYCSAASRITEGSEYSAAFRLQDLLIKGFYDDVNIVNAYLWRITGCDIAHPIRRGIYIKNSLLPDAGDFVISDCFFMGYIPNSIAGVYYESSGGFKLLGCKFNGASLEANMQASTVDFQVLGNSFENTTYSCINFVVTNTISFENINIVGNQFNGANHYAAIYMDGTGGTLNTVNITSNTFNYVYSDQKPMDIRNVTSFHASANTVKAGQAASSFTSVTWTTTEY